MKCWYNLNIDNSLAMVSEANSIESIHNILGFYDNTPLQNCILYSTELTKIVRQEWLDYMKSINLEIICCLVFSRTVIPTSESDVAHKDCVKSQKTHPISINWTIGGDGDPMVWFDEPNFVGVERLLSLHPDCSFFYTAYQENLLNEIDRYIIGTTPTLVRTDIPHSIHVTQSPRISFSFRTKQRFVTWSDQIDFLTNYLVLPPGLEPGTPGSSDRCSTR